MSSNSLRRSRLRLRMGVCCICQSRTIRYPYAVTLILRAVWGLSALRGLCVIDLIRSMGIHNLGSFKLSTNITVIGLTSCHPTKLLLRPPTEPSKLKFRMHIIPLLLRLTHSKTLSLSFNSSSTPVSKMFLVFP